MPLGHQLISATSVVLGKTGWQLEPMVECEWLVACSSSKIPSINGMRAMAGVLLIMLNMRC